MKIALAQLNFKVGDFESNCALMLRHTNRAAESGADLMVFSELSVCGYPPLDLLERRTFIEESIAAIQQLAKAVPAEIGVLVGGPEINQNSEGKILYNSAYFLYGGEIRQVFRKSLLPTYDIFDEYRYFEPNREFALLHFREKKIAVTICEDLWDDQPVENRFSRSRLYTISPMQELMKLEPDFMINMSASPYATGRQQVKRDIFTNKATKHRIPIFMVNQTGANTELIFEGGSMAISSDGSIFRQMAFFQEDYAVFDLDKVTGYRSDTPPDLPERIGMVHQALVNGVKDYFAKSGLKRATLGLSGGIDSAVTLAIAAEALGHENLHVLLMPSQYSSDHSVDDSVAMARILDIKYDIVPIATVFNQLKQELKPVLNHLPEDVTEENIQSRIRGLMLMALSNKLGHILLNTSNKSELAVGYGTLYGDMAGGLSVLGDVYKTDVYALAEYLNREREIIPGHILTKAPSAELKPDQKDSDSLPDYALLDAILEKYIEKQMSAAEITGHGFEKETVEKVIRLVNFNEYKRYQTPPILRISSKAFGDGRRIPLVAKY